MSNVMSLKNIRNNVHRNSFDLSCRNAFTAKVGELLPVCVKEVIPGDKFKLRVESFTRTQPLNSAAFTRIKEYYDWFFVPNRLLWRHFPQFITQTSQQNPQFAASPLKPESGLSFPPVMMTSAITSVFNQILKNSNEQSDFFAQSINLFGYWRVPLMVKLLSYLGYGDWIPKTFDYPSDGNEDYSKLYLNWESVSYPTPRFISPFPLLAYQKIYQDYFRDSQWQRSSPQTCNVDYINTNDNFIIPIVDLEKSFSKGDNNYPCMFDLQYCNWQKDLLMGALPNSQFGDVASVNVDNVIKSSLNVDIPQLSSDALSGHNNGVWNTADGVRNNLQNVTYPGLEKQLNASLNKSSVLQNLVQSSSFNVLALRQAEALQKWREITQSTKLDYKNQIESHFNVRVPDSLSNLCTWVGGQTSSLSINEVVNTNLSDINQNSDNGAFIAGKGVGLLNSNEEFEAHEHGVLMCIYHAVPLLDYSIDGLDPLVLKTTVDRYAIPEFDSIGNELLPVDYFFNVPDSSKKFIGYVPRYVDYKTSIDKVNGAFKDSLQYWVAPLKSSYLYENWDTFTLSWQFFKVNPSILDSIFAVNANHDVNTDQLLINAFFDVKAVRNLDYNGLPY